MFCVVKLTSALYIIWGVELILGLPVALITPIYSNISDFGLSELTMGVIGVLSGLSALLSFAFRRGHLGFLWLMPQQCLLASSAFNAISSAGLGQYPDGTIKPPIFILSDQLPMIVLALLHAAILVRWPEKT